MRPATVILLPFAIFRGQALAHGGKSLGEELQARQLYALHNKMDLNHCAQKFKRDGLESRSLERRIDLWNSLHRDEAHIIRRGDDDHESNKGFSLTTDALETLSTRTDGCVLHPELTEGPYCKFADVQGEHVRGSIIDGQPGAFLFIDLQIVNTESCEPVEGVYVELWHTNATGVYSGVVASGNGSGEDDPENAYTTFGRGAAQTSSDGVVLFTTIFPGHYAGRTPHIHIMTHIDPAIMEDGTIVSSTATHVGQLFFDQAVIDETRVLPQYRPNNQAFTRNQDDRFLQHALRTSDPIFSWTRLKEYDNAVLAWIPVGVNMSNVRHAAVAATLTPKKTVIPME